MKISSVLLLTLSVLSVLSCSQKFPNIKNTENGILAIPIEATNTSRLGYTRYYKIYPNTNPDLIISIIPKDEKKFAFSKEMPPGKYNYNRIKYILENSEFVSTRHMSVQVIRDGLAVEIKPGAVTIASEKLIIKQYDHYDKTKVGYVETDWRFHTVSDAEMEDLIKELKKIEGSDKWKIENEDNL